MEPSETLTLEGQNTLIQGELTSNFDGFEEFLNRGNVLDDPLENESAWKQTFEKKADNFECQLREKKKSMAKSNIIDEEDGPYLLAGVPKLDYEARAYQGEIYGKSKEKNSIVVLETGSGKTIISILHILKFLQRYGNKKMIAFLCIQVNLVEQQRTKIIGFLRRMQFDPAFAFLDAMQPKVVPLHGGKGDNAWVHISKMKEKTSPMILVMTPQYFLNGLRRGYVKLWEFSLVVFDECHNCLGNHPYNQILREFFHRPLTELNLSKPQILGLTATPIAVRKQISDKEIEKELMEMCMNMDSNFCTLEDKGFDFQKSEAQFDFLTYYQDSTLDNIDILAEADRRKLLGKGINFINHWNEALVDILKCLENSTELRTITAQMIMSIEEYFKSKIVNRAVALYFELDNLKELGAYAVYQHFSDIYEQLENVLAQFGFTILSKEKVAKIRELLKMFLHRIKAYDNKAEISNKCLTLINKIKDIFSKSSDNTGIVFVERKYIARVLRKLINTLCPSPVKSEYIIGHGLYGLSPTEDKNAAHDIESSLDLSSFQQVKKLDEVELGMVSDMKKEGKHFKKLFNPKQSLKNQLDNIELFKKGEFNVLVATSLIQEGFDVPNCNFIISLNEPKSVLSMVQIRGRARKQGSKYYVLLSNNTEQEKKRKIFEGLRIMEKIKEIAAQFEKELPMNTSRNNSVDGKAKLLIGGSYGLLAFAEERTENGGSININWVEILTNILCKSMPRNSFEVYKPFYLFFQKNVKGNTYFQCIMLLPNQSNVRISMGDNSPNKVEAKRLAAFEVCKQLKRLNYFDTYLNPKSLNKDFMEFTDINIDPLDAMFQYEFTERLNQLSLETHNFSHFGKRFLKPIIDDNKEDNKVYVAYLHEVRVRNTTGMNWDDKQNSGPRICFVHSSQLPGNIEFDSKDDNTTVKLVFKKMIHLTAKEYQDRMLIHRYLASFVNSTLLQFFSILTNDPPKYYKFEEKTLDYEYELWISHEPSISFFTLVDESFNIARDFLDSLRSYIKHQAKLYLYFNSLTEDGGRITSLWDPPEHEKYSCFDYPDHEKLKEYVIQDVWRLDRYELIKTQELKEIDFYASSDGKTSLQARAIFFIGRFLPEVYRCYYEYGLQLRNLSNKTDVEICFDMELMVSPISLLLYNQLKKIMHAFSLFDQSKLSLKYYKRLIENKKQYNMRNHKSTCTLDLRPAIDVFSYFKGQFKLQKYLFSATLPQNIALNKNYGKYSRNESEQNALEQAIEDIFSIEKDHEDDTNQARTKETHYEALGNKLVELLLVVEVFLLNENEWDYSLERIKKEQIISWKSQSPFLSDVIELFVSKAGNNLLCNAIISEVNRDQKKLCAEYLAWTDLSKIIKTTSYLLYKKEDGNMEDIRRFLFNINLLQYSKLSLCLDKTVWENQSIEVIERLYKCKYRDLEKIIDYKFETELLLIEAFVDVSMRDYYVQWILEEAEYNDLKKIFEFRRQAFEQKKEEHSINLGKAASIRGPFDTFFKATEAVINHYHSKPNNMDRFRWLGQALVDFIVYEWLYQNFSKSMTGKISVFLSKSNLLDFELAMHAKYFSGTQFIVCLSSAYNLDDFLISSQECFDKLKQAKVSMKRENLLALDYYLDDQYEDLRKLWHIASSLFYSLIGAIYLDSSMNFSLTREKALSLIVPMAMDFINKELVEEFAPLKLGKKCLEKGWPLPVIKKEELTEIDSYKLPASSNYKLFIEEKLCSSVKDISLKNAEYSLYALALLKELSD